MRDLDDVRSVFRQALVLPDDYDVDGLQYRSIDNWDSLAHMTLVAAIEDKFDLMIDTDDVIGMSSFQEALKILEKYDVRFAA
jgi:acyl carrier protein